MLRERLQCRQLGHLGICAEQRAADDKADIARRKLLLELADDGHDGVVSGGDAEQDLDGGGILLRKPASEAVFGEGIAALQGL
jgi:hypothetical protein